MLQQLSPETRNTTHKRSCDPDVTAGFWGRGGRKRTGPVWAGPWDHATAR